MRHNTKITGILVALIATTMVFAVQAKNRNGQKRAHRGMNMGFIAQTLELTDAQQKKIDALKAKESEKIGRIQKDMDALRDQMRAQWEKDEVNKKEVKALQKKMHDLRGKMGEAHTEFRLGVYDVLTKEQRQKAAAERRRLHKEGRPGNGAMGDCPRGNRGNGDGCGRGRGQGRGHGQGQGRGPAFDGQDAMR
ncbi:MAG: Spy/CpxP family protein refolding chaperone [Deltaproteobacteria bacterium]|nr:Spy/CpxP family protein refolding chaperone [Deltaproteobacteria bacterium]MBN2670322.1 Spy/CpxP family protein refolding chaperone [Deltaproteobacteria bacterium]